MPKKDPKRKKNTGKTPQQSHIPRRYYFLFWLGVNRIPVENSNWTFFSTTEYRTTKMKRAKTHSCCGCTSVEKGKKRKGKGEQMWGPKKWKKLSWVMRPLPPPPSNQNGGRREEQTIWGPLSPPPLSFKSRLSGAWVSRHLHSAGPSVVRSVFAYYKICFRALPGMKKSCN